jgi:hypothetical protein
LRSNDHARRRTSASLDPAVRERARRSWRHVAGVLLGAQAVCACSLVFTREPRLAHGEDGERVRCTESRAAPRADAAAAAAAFIAAGALVAHGATLDRSRNERECGSCLAYALALGPAGYSVLFGLSSYVGFDRTRRCERAHRLEERCFARDDAACAALQHDAEAR